MLHAAGIDPPRLVFAHGWLLVGGEKMSKTKLTGIHPDDLVDAFGADAYRYYFMREVAFGQDGNFSWESLQARYNAELANGLGNLGSRVLAMIASYFGGAVPEPGDPREELDRRLEETAARTVGTYLGAMDRFAFHEALEAVDAIVRQANGYLVETAPWVLAKDDARRARLATVLWSAAESLRVLAVLLSPFMPDACERLWAQLGVVEPLARQHLPAAAAWGGLAPGTKVTKGDALFPRVDAR
jgi:methionyl-tRNA synthetase